jgi:methyl-accepting chemotaxis protein
MAQNTSENQLIASNSNDPLRAIHIAADNVMLIILAVHFLYCLALTQLYGEYSAFLLVGLPTAVAAILLTKFKAGHVQTRMVVASAFMVFTALAIHD